MNPRDYLHKIRLVIWRNVPKSYEQVDYHYTQHKGYNFSLKRIR